VLYNIALQIGDDIMTVLAIRNYRSYMKKIALTFSDYSEKAKGVL